MNQQFSNHQLIPIGRVAIGGYPPKAPTDPYLRTLAHTAPRYERFATLGTASVLFWLV